MNTLKRLLVVPVLALLAVLAAPMVAFASAPPPVQADTTNASTFVLAAPLVTLLVSVLIPLINGFFTKPSTPTGVKAVGTIILNAIYAILINGLAVDGSSAFSTTTLYTAIIGSVISIAMYAGVYKPLNVTSNAGGKLATVGRSD